MRNFYKSKDSKFSISSLFSTPKSEMYFPVVVYLSEGKGSETILRDSLCGNTSYVPQATTRQIVLSKTESGKSENKIVSVKSK